MPVVRTFDSGSTSFLRYQRALKSGSMCSKPGIAKPVFQRFFLLDSESSPDPVCPDLVGIGLLHYGSFDFIAWVAVLLLAAEWPKP